MKFRTNTSGLGTRCQHDLWIGDVEIAATSRATRMMRFVARVVTTTGSVVSLNARLQGTSVADKRDICCPFLLPLLLAKWAITESQSTRH
jgi:hypothetical protein